MSPEARQANCINMAALVTLLMPVLLGLYALSYAPMARLCQSADLAAYRPVDGLIDHTPLREPLIWWADRCGVGEEIRLKSQIRDLKRILGEPEASSVLHSDPTAN